MDDDLQFRKAEPLAPAPEPARPACVICHTPIEDDYFHAQGQVVCPTCAGRIESGQQAPPKLSLARAVLYGLGAALAGSALYALVAIVTGLELGLIAIVIGWLVGKAIRHASNGLGGRRQQILAVVLTYLAITTSYIPVIIYHQIKSPPRQSSPAQSQQSDSPEARPRLSPGRLVVLLLAYTAAAPFFELFANPVGGLLSLVIIFIGLRQAWVLTGRTDILITGPYKLSEA